MAVRFTTLSSTRAYWKGYTFVRAGTLPVFSCAMESGEAVDASISLHPFAFLNTSFLCICPWARVALDYHVVLYSGNVGKAVPHCPTYSSFLDKALYSLVVP